MLIIYTMTTQEVQDRNVQIEALIAKMADSDVSAMGDLYELIRADIYAFALSKIGRKEEAEDVTHDTFVRIWQNAPSYTPMGKPMAWILTIELNLIRRACELSARSGTELDETLPDPDSDVEGRVINSEFLRQLLQELSAEARQVVTLHLVSGLKHREIAQILNEPLVTVISRYRRAIKKLQIIVKEADA